MLAALQVAVDGDENPAMDSVLSAEQFALWADLLEQRLGIAVTPQRKTFLESRLRMRMRELGMGDFQSYYALVTAPQRGLVEWSLLLDRLTIHETRFNRHAASFRMLQEEYLPGLLQQHEGSLLNIRAWSVGCASGEEAYGLAMLLDGALRQHRGKSYFGVIGTDISLESLAEARKGCYPAERLRSLDEAVIERYFSVENGCYLVDTKLRQRVAFSQLNVLMLEKAPYELQDIIFCQNLLIYFSQEKRHAIVNMLTHFLKPDGILVLAPGELINWQCSGMAPVKFEDTLAYRRVKD